MVQIVTCPRCSGTGQFVVRYGASVYVGVFVRCLDCRGSGVIEKEICLATKEAKQ
jgi:DnaJ-class molecular chaperone